MISLTWLAWYYAIVLLLMGLAWYPCCCEGGTSCAFCASGTMPESITVTLADVDDEGSCDCSDVNGTYVLSPDEVNGCKRIKATSEFFCGTSGISRTVYAVITNASSCSGSNVAWVVSFEHYVAGPPSASRDEQIWEWDSGDTDAVDCSAYREATWCMENPANNWNSCDWTSATCEINL